MNSFFAPDYIQRLVNKFSDRGAELNSMESLVRGVCFQLLQLALPEAVFLAHEALPTAYIEAYTLQEHFSLTTFIDKRIFGEFAGKRLSKHIAYTRSTPSLLKLSAMLSDTKTISSFSQNKTSIISLERVKTESDLVGLLEAFYHRNDEGTLLLIILCDLRKLKETQINQTRLLLESLHKETSEKSIMMLLHFPPSSMSVSMHKVHLRTYRGGESLLVSNTNFVPFV